MASENSTSLCLSMGSDHGGHGIGGDINHTVSDRAVTILEKLVENRKANSKTTEPIVLCDYGTAAGVGFIAHIYKYIDVIRSSLATVPIVLVFEDQPHNDFNSLVSNIEDLKTDLSAKFNDVYTMISATGFFSSCLPPNFVDIGFCSAALHYLSKKPMNIPDHYWAARSRHTNVRDAFAEQSQKDWVNFLQRRAAELKPGGHLLIQQGTETGDVLYDLDILYSVWKAFPKEGIIHETEVMKTSYPAYHRSYEDVMEPFINCSAESSNLECLSCEEIDVHLKFMDPVSELTDAMAFKLARKRVDESLSWGQHVFQSAMDPTRDIAEQRVILKTLRDRAIKLASKTLTSNDVTRKHTYTITHITKRL